MKIKLYRLNDGLELTGVRVDWIEWNEYGTVKAKHEKPDIGLSCLIDGHYGLLYTWLTTEIIGFQYADCTDHPGYICVFTTKNSEYKLEYYGNIEKQEEA